MKTFLTLVFASLMLVALAPQASALTVDSAAGVASLGQTLDASSLVTGGLQVPNFLQPVEASWGLPACQNIEGTSCSTPGAPGVRCSWYPWEPGVCFCQSNYTMLCG